MQLTEQFLSSIDVEEFKERYFNYSNADIINYYNISRIVLINCVEKLQLGKKDNVKIAQLSYERKTGFKHNSQNPETRKKARQTITERYGENYEEQRKEKVRKTTEEKYGKAFYSNPEQARNTCLEKYGVDNASKSKDIIQKIKDSITEHFGGFEYLHDDAYKIQKYGSLEQYEAWRYTQWENSVVQKCGSLEGAQTYMHQQRLQSMTNRRKCAQREWACMRPEARNYGKNNSNINIEMYSLLSDLFKDVKPEFCINRYSYDFKVDNILLEVNPTITHNSTISPFNQPKEKNYHLDRTKLAIESGYRCVNIWDWDNLDLIFSSILENKIKVYARKCELKVVKEKKLVNDFLMNNHLQGTCRGQTICIGLYYKDELIQIMTFGTPRYNKHYTYELLRLCTKCGYFVVGGAEKLFNYFKQHYDFESIISYCDNSKFSGKVYNTLGMKLISFGTPSKHWYNMKTKVHITNNLLMQLGYDKLFNTNYGKNSSNEQLMLNSGFVEIYDAGQSSYEYIK